MDYQIFNEPFPHVIIENTFDEYQLKLLWRELDFLLDKLGDPEEYAAAQRDDDTYLTTAKGRSLDTLYGDREVSDILKITEDVFFTNAKLYEELLEHNDYWVTWKESNADFTKVRRYYPGDGYEPHADYWVHVLITTTFCHAEDTGGNLYFPKHDYEIETKNNKTVVFPGWIQHAVTDVVENDRYAITKFVQCDSKRG